jgi:hypothetical protein
MPHTVCGVRLTFDVVVYAIIIQALGVWLEVTDLDFMEINININLVSIGPIGLDSFNLPSGSPDLDILVTG